MEDEKKSDLEVIQVTLTEILVRLSVLENLLLLNKTINLEDYKEQYEKFSKQLMDVIAKTN